MADSWSTDPLEFIAWYGKTMSMCKFQMLNTMLHLTSREEIPKGQPGYDPWVELYSDKNYLAEGQDPFTQKVVLNLLEKGGCLDQSVYFRKGPVLLVVYKQKPTRKPVYLISTAYHAQDQVIRNRGSGMEAIKPYVDTPIQ
ncbi:hypothetical protein J6590_032416 [Homalodisca vitripennis]|nr:hypothetical protein J6590_032416 [Homalodisca vitripennis]